MRNYLIVLTVSLFVIGGLIAGCQQSGEIPAILKIVDRSPVLNATGVSVTAPLSITFNFPIYNNKITRENLFTEYLQFGAYHSAGNPTITALTWSVNQKTLTITVAGWSGDSSSAVHILPRSDKLKDIFNNPISVDLWKYTFGGTFPTTTTSSTTTTTTTISTSTSTSTTTTTTTTTTLPDFSWTQKTGSAAFAGRSQHTSVVFDNKMWVIGGIMTGSAKTNDAWASTDGLTWNLMTGEASFVPTYLHSSLIFDNKIWVIGGNNASGYTNEVWSSADGISWTMITPEAAFAPRGDHSNVVFNGKMWIIGGDGLAGARYSDVWYSSNGADWSQATGTANFGPRSRHSSLVLDGMMWVIGGWDTAIFNDAWHSSDGINWTRASSISAFGGNPPSSSETSRIDHTSVVYELNADNKMFVIGGANSWPGPSISYLNDLWYSDNGVNWTDATPLTNYTSRSAHSSVVLNNKIWIIGGYDGSNYLNDVWYSPLP
jgi:hypothetical protein